MTAIHSSQAFIQELLSSTGAPDAPTAIRQRAAELIGVFESMFGVPERPINIELLASLQGITLSDDAPLHSQDAELAPDGRGGVTMRVSPDRPLTRQRFSMAHEVAHTFFPEYRARAWCRPDSRYRDRSNPNDYIEMLCDMGAAELLFPLPWFRADATAVGGAAGLIQLAEGYLASREATLRRYVETSAECVAAAFFVWKLKPTQLGVVGRKSQGNLLGITPEEEVRDAIRLRIDYSIGSPSFRQDGYFLPKNKSIPNTGPIYDAAATGAPMEGELYLDLGQAAGTYCVWAVPLWTPRNELGSKGENAAVAVLRPVSVRRPATRRSASAQFPTLFDDL